MSATDHPSSRPPITIGWREFIALPEWGIRTVRAKIDTGARTSAIHTGEIETLEDGRVRFEVVVRERPTRKTVWVTAEPVRESVVKPSSGERQQRIVCRTRMRLGEVERDIELSLVRRDGMLCRMLLGRRGLGDAFLVDPSRKYLVSGRRFRLKKKSKSKKKQQRTNAHEKGASSP